jgi:hypothetical protein
MALTNAEKQKRWRDRGNALAKHAEAMAKEGRLRNQPGRLRRRSRGYNKSAMNMRAL